MRRLVFPTIAAMGLILVGSSSALADDPTPAPTVSAKSTPGKKLCKIADPEMNELSGLAALKNGFAAVNDGKEDNRNAKIYFLDRECKKVDQKSFSGEGPRDPEDIVLSPDGKTLWIADIGDNKVRTDPQDTRPTIALWSMPADGSEKAVIHRLTYPEGDKHDAEALIFNGDGTPLIVTKEIGADTSVYQPTTALKANTKAGVPMKKVATLQLSATETAGNPVARIGNRTVTGGAVTRGATKVVLRTYTDALEWDVTNGDVVGALKNTPRTTGLPNEPLGESIAYSTDGTLFYTVSDMSGETDVANHIREYSPATTVAKVSEKSGTTDTGSAWYLDPDNLAYAVGGVGLFGLILVGAGVFGIVRFRKSPPPRPAAASASDRAPSGGIDTGDPETELIGVGGAPQRGASYSGRPAGGGGGPVYGAKSGPAAAGQRGNGPIYSKQGGAQQGGQGGRPAGQPPRGPQPQGGGQPPRGPQQGGGQPRPPQGGQPRPPQGGQPRPPQGGQPRPPQGGQPRPPQGGQPRPPQGGQQRPPQGGQPRGPQQGGQGGRPAGQPPRGPQPQGGGQPPRGPQQSGQQRPQQQGGGPRGPQQGGQPRGPQQQGGPRGPQQGGQGGRPGGQPPRGPQQGGGGGR
ncbi:MAG TPA: hypothetical protein VN408_11230 [Actinoplanes sp.]|nr:hypothetical protein [Actinoplanes sp.]